MLEYLKKLNMNEIDFVTFLEGDKKNTILILGHQYLNKGEKVGGSLMGDSWHIILFQSHSTKDKYTNLDFFDAIFSDPREYISGLIPQGWYGIVARKTTTSKKIVDKLLAKCKEGMI